MNNANQNPQPGQTLWIAFNEHDIPDAVVVQYEEVPLEGACTLTTEYLMVDIEGRGVHTLTRHNVMPDTDPWWCVSTMEDRMVCVMTPGPKDAVQRLIREAYVRAAGM